MAGSSPGLPGRGFARKKGAEFNGFHGSIVMAGLDPAIHAMPFRIDLAMSTQRHRVDGRVKRGHDDTQARP
jgi:hypothetical protein